MPIDGFNQAARPRVARRSGRHMMRCLAETYPELGDLRRQIGTAPHGVGARLLGLLLGYRRPRGMIVG